MKSGSLKKFIGLIVSFAVLLFLYVATISEIKNMNKEKINKIEELNEKRNRIEIKLVEVQKLTTEERIVKLAQENLGLIRPKENLDRLEVSKSQIEQIQKLVNQKYD